MQPGDKRMPSHGEPLTHRRAPPTHLAGAQSPRASVWTEFEVSLGPVARVLGDGNAENERDLVRAFLRTHDYDEVAANSRFLVLGGRGAGKSAIFRMLSLDSA